MIKEINIRNYKSHANSTIGLANINIFTGMNGMGKSSAIQMLLLLRQTHNRNLLHLGLELNGELFSAGTVKDAVYQFAESDNIDIMLRRNDDAFEWSFIADAFSVGNTFARALNPNNYQLSEFSLFNNKFQYISAYRFGPTNNYEKDTASVELLNQISRKEGRCELVAHFLHYFRDYIVDADLVKNTEVGATVKNQVEEWMKEISPNIVFNIHPGDASYKITYDFSRGAGLTKLEGINAVNTGFGVSYVLPIIAAAIVSNSRNPQDDSLLSANGYTIIIENPEAHIHPSAQAKLMELICMAAKKGVQFIIETHSDHIINSVLVAIKDEVLNAEQVKMHFFTREETSNSTIVEQLNVLPGGKIKNPPRGFFDQIDIHMRHLMGF